MPLVLGLCRYHLCVFHLCNLENVYPNWSLFQIYIILGFSTNNLEIGHFLKSIQHKNFYCHPRVPSSIKWGKKYFDERSKQLSKRLHLQNQGLIKGCRKTEPFDTLRSNLI